MNLIPCSCGHYEVEHGLAAGIPFFYCKGDAILGTLHSLHIICECHQFKEDTLMYLELKSKEIEHEFNSL